MRRRRSLSARSDIAGSGRFGERLRSRAAHLEPVVSPFDVFAPDHVTALARHAASRRADPRDRGIGDRDRKIALRGAAEIGIGHVLRIARDILRPVGAIRAPWRHIADRTSGAGGLPGIGRNRSRATRCRNRFRAWRSALRTSSKARIEPRRRCRLMARDHEAGAVLDVSPQVAPQLVHSALVQAAAVDRRRDRALSSDCST